MTNKSFTQDSKDNLKYWVPSIMGVLTLSGAALAFIMRLRRRKFNKKTTLHKPPVLRPNIYKPNNTFEMRHISSSDEYLQPNDSQIYCSTIEPIYDVIT